MNKMIKRIMMTLAKTEVARKKMMVAGWSNMK